MRATVSLVILGALGLLVPTATAATPRTVASCDGARIDKAAGLARSLSDCGSVDLGQGREEAARQAVGRVASSLGVKRSTSDLSLVRSSTSRAGARVRFQQYVSGVPVRNGQVAVALGTHGSVLHVASGASDDRTLDATPSVSRADALLTARRRVPSGFDTVVPPSTTLVADPGKGGVLTLAWEVVLATRAPRADWHVLVSARTGEVLQAANQIWRVDGSALTYSPNPVQMTGNTGLRDMNDADQAALDSARASFVLPDLNAGTNQLRGTLADLVATGTDPSDCSLGYTPGSASSASRIYNFTRTQNQFEEAAAYLAVTRVRRTYAELGFPSIFPGPVPINAHCIAADNSFFSDADGALHMGDGGVDDAEDSDVTIHEFGHATQAAQVPGWGPGQDTEQRAMGEGFGDFLATNTYLQDGDPTYQAARRFCVMEWDATSYNPVVGADDGSGCLRWADGTDENDGSDIGAYGGAPQEEHDDGRYWAATLTCVFEGMETSLGTTQARNRILTLALAHHEDLVPTEDNGAFEDAVLALRVEDTARFGGAELGLIDDCAEQRLALQPDTSPPVVTGSLNPAAPDGANGWYRTAPAIAWSYSDAQSRVFVNGCQAGASLEDTTGRTVNCAVTSRGGLTSKSLTYRKDATAPVLAATISSTRPQLGQAITVAPNASDATSGVATQACGPTDTSTAGTKAVICSATDAAGNQATQTLVYTVAGSTSAPATFRASKPKLARNGNVSFRVRASRSIRVRVSARAGKVRFRTQSIRLTQNRNIKITLRLTKKQRRAFRKRLRTGRTVKITVTLKPAGVKATKLTLRVRRR
jgi:hypothetical protein